MFSIIQELWNGGKSRVLTTAGVYLDIFYKLAKGPQMNNDNNAVLLLQMVQIYNIIYVYNTNRIKSW